MLLSHLRNLLSRTRSSNYTPVEDVYSAGEIYAFKTQPVHDFDKADTGRYGVVKILGINPDTPGQREENLVCYVVLDGVFGTMPAPKDVSNLTVLKMKRFAYDNKVAAERIRADTTNTLTDFTFITRVDLTPAEQKILRNTTNYSGLGAANTNVEMEWRWRNDREQVIADVARDEADRAAKSKEYEAQKKQHLDSLRFEMFLDGQIFVAWQKYLPDSVVQDLEAQFAQSATALCELGSKPKRGQVRAVLKALVTDINTLNMRQGGFIETLHREYLCDRISDLAYLASQPKLIDEVDDWRDW